MVGRRSHLLLTSFLICVSLFFIAFVNKRPDVIAVNFPAIATYRNCKGNNTIVRISDFASRVLNESSVCASGKIYYEKYCVISPYEEAVKNVRAPANVTLCTQSTVEFLHHAAVLCHRWAGPISVAIYCPGEDYNLAKRTVNTLRECDSCIKYWISWHFILDKNDKPSEDEQWVTNCEDIVAEEKGKKRRSGGSYPINVARNVARQQADSPFVFSVDIELYPSIGILPKFERMLKSWTSGFKNQVWVFPVFEVYIQQPAPLTKQQLRKMFQRKEAISFHQYRCNLCHRIPNLKSWLESEGELCESKDSLQSLKVWSTVKRNKDFKLQYWEPFFIGTNQDPDFDIRLSWEGKQNKMQMAYEMCMRNYDFHIVQNGFLVHAPGINKYNANAEKERQKYIPENEKIMRQIRKDLNKKHKINYNCE